MSTVSIETAVRLEAAGFQQPEFAFGQLWEVPNSHEWAFVGTAQFHLMKQHFAKEIIFRPTATDILRELPGYPPNIEWTGYSYMVNAGRIRKIDDNAAEAAAIAWLEINEKTTEQ